MLQPNLRSSYI